MHGMHLANKQSIIARIISSFFLYPEKKMDIEEPETYRQHADILGFKANTKEFVDSDFQTHRIEKLIKLVSTKTWYGGPNCSLY